MIEDLLDSAKIDLVSASMERSASMKKMRERNELLVYKARDQYAPTIAEMLMQHCRASIAETVGEALLDSYAYWRIYDHGGILEPHRDRAACEISVSIPIACKPEGMVWPIKVESVTGETHEFALNPGCALVLLGSKLMHWREPFAGSSQKQLLFHYVLKNGEFADHALDGREQVATAYREAHGG